MKNIFRMTSQPINCLDNWLKHSAEYQLIEVFTIPIQYFILVLFIEFALGYRNYMLFLRKKIIMYTFLIFLKNKSFIFRIPFKLRNDS